MRALPRRGILRGLATLPLIGGSVDIIGAPRAVAEPVTATLLSNYHSWLFFERRLLAHELARLPEVQRLYGRQAAGVTCFDTVRAVDNHIRCDNAGGEFHTYKRGHEAATRAALVLSTVGVDWKAVRP